MERILAIGDIHGCYTLLRKLLEEIIRFDPAKDRLVFLGDYIDRGPNSVEVVDWLFDDFRGAHPDSVILLRGNHEEVFLRLPETHALWMRNGGGATMHDAVRLNGTIEAFMPGMKKRFSTLTRTYYEEEGFIFVHAGLQDGGLGVSSESDMMNLRNYQSYQGPLIIVGHTPHHFVTRYANVIVVDTGAFATGKLSAYDVKNGVVYTTNGIEPLKIAE